MIVSSTTVKYLVTGLLAAGWLAYYRVIIRLNPFQPYHLAAYNRDRRKARFYFYSVWIGLGLTAMSFLALEALQAIQFETGGTRDWVMGALRGIGTTGLMVIAAVWSQVGIRASQLNSDGQSLQQAPEEEKNNKPRDR